MLFFNSMRMIVKNSNRAFSNMRRLCSVAISRLLITYPILSFIISACHYDFKASHAFD